MHPRKKKKSMQHFYINFLMNMYLQLYEPSINKFNSLYKRCFFSLDTKHQYIIITNEGARYLHVWMVVSNFQYHTQPSGPA